MKIRVKYYINLLNPKYNIYKIPGVPLRNTKGYPHPDETKAKLSKYHSNKTARALRARDGSLDA